MSFQNDGDHDEHWNVELSADAIASFVGDLLATDQSFLAKLRANQIKRGRVQTNIYGHVAQHKEPKQQTRKIT